MSTSLEQSLDAYASHALHRLTSQEETFVQRRAIGVNPIAAARLAGYKNPTVEALKLAERPEIEQAIVHLREAQRQTAIGYGVIEFSKDDATALYLAAHAKAENSTEEIRAVDSLVKLHGLAAPEKREVVVSSREQMEALTDEELMQMSGVEIKLSPEDYVEVTGNE